MANMELKDLTVPYKGNEASDWNEIGVVLLPDFMPEDLMAAYEDCWIRLA